METAMALEAVIWDFGGVLTASPFEAFNRYEAERGLPADFLRQVNAAHPEGSWALFERSEIDADAFDRLFRAESAALGHAVPGAEVLPLLQGSLRPAMVAALGACKAHFRTGCITNNMALGGPSAAMDQVRPLFDEVIESATVGVRKPDPRIYLMMCDRLGVRPGVCVYLDDLGVNCKAAHLLGMTAIKVTDEAGALRELSRATGLKFARETA